MFTYFQAHLFRFEPILSQASDPWLSLQNRMFFLTWIFYDLLLTDTILNIYDYYGFDKDVLLKQLDSYLLHCDIHNI